MQVCTVSDMFGSEFQREGAMMEKALSPQAQCSSLSGGERSFH